MHQRSLIKAVLYLFFGMPLAFSILCLFMLSAMWFLSEDRSEWLPADAVIINSSIEDFDEPYEMEIDERGRDRMRRQVVSPQRAQQLVRRRTTGVGSRDRDHDRYKRVRLTRPNHAANFVYEYHVDGELYTGSERRTGDHTLPVADRIAQLEQNWPVDKELAIYYDPSSPSDSSLVKQGMRDVLVYVMPVLVVIALFLMFMVSQAGRIADWLLAVYERSGGGAPSISARMPGV